MTGPEHYQLAEFALEHAKDCEPGSEQMKFLLAIAQVRATLALAAATAMGALAGHDTNWSAMPKTDAAAWSRVAGVKAEADEAVSRG